MNTIVQAFRLQLAAIKRNPLVVFLIAATAAAVLYVGYHHGSMKQAIAYLLVMWLCSFFTDVYAVWQPAKQEFEVRNPPKESLYFLICLVLGLIFFFVRFSGIVDWPNLPGLVKLAFMPMILFVYPIGLAIIMLLLKYKPRDLGIRVRGFIVAIPIITISALTNRLISPESLTWGRIMAESGSVVNALFTGLVLAGLSEEFFRFVGQTRLGALFNNKGLGWFLTTVIWAFMHAPKWYSEDHNISEALLGSIRIIPIGLMWGYITHRTKSILPSVLVHGTNYWGLQNF